MSEYQYYEFRTVDRSLSPQEMAELRDLSTRATITPTRFVNVYNYGDFRGSPSELMNSYFDGFVYVANWGAREFMLRLPQRLLAPETAETYRSCESLTVRPVDDFVVLEFTSYDEDRREGWITDGEAAGWLPALLPIREELARGDLRCLYLGWLLCAQTWLEDDEIEPPVPPGLGILSPALRTFAEFFWIDEHLIEVAAERSEDLNAFAPTQEKLRRWIHELPDTEKDELLLRIATDDDTSLRAELLRRFQMSTQAVSKPATARRTVGQIIAAAEQRAEVKRREEEARARAAYLDDLASREDETWRRVEALIETKRPGEYDEAVELLKDLRDLAVRSGQGRQFRMRLSAIREQHATKKALLRRLQRAGLHLQAAGPSPQGQGGAMT